MAVIISSSLVLNEAEASIPLTYPRILYDDIVRDATVTASTEAAGFQAVNVADGVTWDFWKPTALPATLEVETAEAMNVDYAMLVHTLGSNECSVLGEYHNGSIWVEMFGHAPGSDRVLAFMFEEVTASRFRLTINAASGSAVIPVLKIVMMGKALVMQYGVTLDHGPITLSRKTVVRPQVSEGGQLLGRSIRREGVGTTLEFKQLEATWLRTYFEPFMLSALVYPFGWVWHPVSYPAEVAFVWTPAGKADIHPKHDGLQDRLSVSFDIEGVIE